MKRSFGSPSSYQTQAPSQPRMDVNSKENELAKREGILEERERQIEEKLQTLDKKLETAEKTRKDLVEKLEKSASMGADEAKKILLENVEKDIAADISKKIKEADVVLGIFGATRKTQMVIPNKVYEGLALGKAVITADTPAIRELLTDHENVLLCKAGDPQDLANKILELKRDSGLRLRIGVNGHTIFTSKLTPKIIVGDLLHVLFS